MNNIAFPRHMMDALKKRLSTMPAAIVTGARQTGKSTLVKELMSGKRSYFSLDDLDVLELSRTNPDAEELFKAICDRMDKVDA